MAFPLPIIEGKLSLTALPADYTGRIAKRVETGLLQAGNRSRANYKVGSLDDTEVSFHAEDFATATNVGLNRVNVWRSGENELSWRISYWRWTGYSVGLCGAIGIALALSFIVMPGMKADISASPAYLAIFWGNIVFWGLLWPWIMVAMHGRVLRRELSRILRETLA